jgi:hypothetical protein
MLGIGEVVAGTTFADALAHCGKGGCELLRGHFVLFQQMQHQAQGGLTANPGQGRKCFNSFFYEFGREGHLCMFIYGRLTADGGRRVIYLYFLFM